MRKKVRETSGNWLTVAYCRKSKCNVSQEQRVKLIQRMVEILKVKCLCEKVYVSPVCFASSLLLERDFSNNTATVMDKNKYKDGHFQGFVMLAKSSSANIRLVILDYAGLTTNPEDLLKLIRKLKSVKEIVIYKGYTYEILSRQHLLQGEVAKKFDCRPSPVKRSTL
ncbi:hypothetical protein FB192DRAFT_1405552 [Mucor lusitanicus]|nr:hypothetical protein FB192DRAFT_1405552 [Mucor lusitanicus]